MAQFTPLFIRESTRIFANQSFTNAQGGLPNPPYFAGFANPARAFRDLLLILFAFIRGLTGAPFNQFTVTSSPR
jgi:hypothetical protein